MATDNIDRLGVSTVVSTPLPTSLLVAQRRKLSFPASLHANLLGLPSSTNAEPSAGARRRFSNVGDVVSRKLSNTIGWRTLPVPPQEVVAQGKALCCRYIRARLKRSGIFSKKLGLYRLRSVVGTPSASIVNDVFPSLVAAGVHLEQTNPRLYTSVARQASCAPTGALVSEKGAASLLGAVGRELLRPEVTWGKVVAVFAVAGGLAVDCVCHARPDHLHALVEAVAELLEDDVAEWIASNGGWTSLAAQCRVPNQEVSAHQCLTCVAGFVAVVIVVFIFIRCFLRLW